MSELVKRNVWSFGGGTQSCAIAALVITGRLPRPDHIVIADTGRECASTWEYLRAHVQPALANVGLSVVVLKASEWGYGGDHLFSKSGELLIPAYTNQSGENGKLSGFCSRWWKVDCISRWCSRQGMKPSKVRTWIGYGFEEQNRWARCMAGEDYKKGRIFLPLVTEFRARRHECQRLIEAIGWPVPAPKSRCWMCPNQRESEWRELPRDEFQKAVELEREIHKRDPHAFLHKSMKPLDQVDFSQPDDLFTRPCDSGNCFL